MEISISLTDERYKKLSVICSDIAQVTLASVVIPYMLETFDLLLAILGMIATLLFGAFSILLS